MSTEDILPPNPRQLEQTQVRGMADNGKDNVEAVFGKIDDEICRSESECPGPRLSILQSWIEHLEHKREVKMGEINEREVLADTRAHLQRRRSSTVSTVSTSAAAGDTISKSEINMILSHERNDTMKVRQVCILIEVQSIECDTAKSLQTHLHTPDSQTTRFFNSCVVPN